MVVFCAFSVIWFHLWCFSVWMFYFSLLDCVFVFLCILGKSWVWVLTSSSLSLSSSLLYYPNLLVAIIIKEYYSFSSSHLTFPSLKSWSTWTSRPFITTLARWTSGSVQTCVGPESRPLARRRARANPISGRHFMGHGGRQGRGGGRDVTKRECSFLMVWIKLWEGSEEKHVGCRVVGRVCEVEGETYLFSLSRGNRPEREKERR